MSKELETAIAAAKASGEVLRHNFGTTLDVRYKGPVDLVTQVDEESERVTTTILQEAFPTYGILAEESGRSAGEADARWIVDPLDGTTNYAHALPLFAVSIALEKAGELTAGVVYNPISEEMFVAERRCGATLNGEPIKVTEADQLPRSLLITGFPYDRDLLPEALSLWNKFIMGSQGVRRLGSAALDICWVAAGRFDGYYEKGIHAYDIAAGCVILAEAGGKLSDYNGGPMRIEGREVIASNGPLHEAIVEITSGRLGACDCSRRS